MLRLKANKTALYKLVADYVDNLPPMRSGTEFIKYPRTPDYALNWITPEWDTAHAFFSACMGRPLLAIEIKDGETGKTVSRTTHDPPGSPGAGHGGGVRDGGGAPADRKECRQWRTFSRYLKRNTA